MDFTALVDVGIGLTVVYLGASLFVTVLNEYIAQIFELRGRQLARDLANLIEDRRIRADLAKMPAFSALFDGNKKTATSYVESAQLATQLAALVATQLATPVVVKPAGSDGAQDAGATELLRQGGAFEKQLAALWDLSEGHRDVFVLHLGTWIEKSLTAMGEVYKQRMQVISFGVGLVLSMVLNLNTIRIVEHLWEDKQVRGALAVIGVESARAITQEQTQRCTAARATESEPA